MKKSTTLLYLGLALSTSGFLASCKDSAESADSSDAKTEKKAEVKKDTPDSLTDELIVQMNKLADTLAGIKDKESAETAVKTLSTIGDDCAAIAQRLDKLDTPSEEVKESLNAKMDKAEESMKEKMDKAMPEVFQIPEVAQIIGPAMQEFGTKMQESDEIFKRFGKKD